MYRSVFIANINYLQRSDWYAAPRFGYSYAEDYNEVFFVYFLNSLLILPLQDYANSDEDDTRTRRGGGGETTYYEHYCTPEPQKVIVFIVVLVLNVHRAVVGIKGGKLFKIHLLLVTAQVKSPTSRHLRGKQIGPTVLFRSLLRAAP